MLEELLEQIYTFGEANDKVTTHTEQMLNITPDTGVFLSMIVQAIKAKSVLEIGTSNGYSTIWLADALLETGGKVITVESSRRKAAMARDNFQKSKLSDLVDLYVQDIREFLKRQNGEIYDLVFLDAERPEYISYWQDIDRVLKYRGLLIVDNALSPKPEELIELFKLIQQTGRYTTLTLQIGKGETIALKKGKS